jgi:1-aminocyclopropane-1-carboxylate deaminase/D-cysteine desulfhydrase-like pyridoxal-dependent ACC family enzyme
VTAAARAATPLVRRFPALAEVPRVELGDYPTPVEGSSLPGLERLLYLKRDDLAAPALGGNKVRALEFLLANVQPNDLVLTGGGEGSTHVLATAIHARRLGARLHAVRWRHEMGDIAHAVADRARGECARVETSWWSMTGIVRTLLRRATSPAHWVPFGGTSPLGILGHINAGLEVAEQVVAGKIPGPARIVVPLGTGGTAVGIALGMAAAGLETVVIGARVVPRIAANHLQLMALVRSTTRWLRHRYGVVLPRLSPHALRIAHDAYGGAYGRVVPRTMDAAAALAQARGITLDATYSAKAFAVAMEVARTHESPTLFWCTFDARWIAGSSGGSSKE